MEGVGGAEGIREVKNKTLTVWIMPKMLEKFIKKFGDREKRNTQ